MKGKHLLPILLWTLLWGLFFGTLLLAIDRLPNSDLSGQFHAYQHDPDDPSSLSGNTVTVIREDRSGTLWLGTLGEGINRFDRETERFTRYQHDPADPQSLSDNTVWTIFEDTDGFMWIGTSAGLEKFDIADGTFTYYGEEDGLPSGGVMSILEDDAHLWISTSNGLSRFNPQTEMFRNYDVSDGLQGNDFVWGSAFKSQDGELFFGGMAGFNAFRPEDTAATSAAPPWPLPF